MKATLAISSRGVVTLPTKLREAVGLRPEDPVIAETTPEGLLLRPAVTLPVEIYTDARIRELDRGEAELGAVLNPLFGQRVGGIAIHSPRTLAEQVLAGPRTRK